MSRRRKLKILIFKIIVWAVGLGCLFFAAGVVLYILMRGLSGLTLGFFTSGPSALYGRVGILPYLLNTLYVVVLTLLISIPVGVCASAYLNVYLPAGRLKSLLQYLLDIMLGIPTIVSGLFGLTFFCRFLGLKNSLLAGALTMSITMVPLIMYTTRTALRSVPSIRVRQATAMGATRWHIIWRIMLPECMPSVRYGLVLAASRIVAESAALFLTAGAGGIVANSVAEAYASSGATLAVYLYIAVQHQGDVETAFSVAAVLVLLVLALNITMVRYSGSRQRPGARAEHNRIHQ